METSLPECIRILREIYVAGNLRVLVGAGVSIPSGFPDWDTLNKQLLRSFLHKKTPFFGPHLVDMHQAALDRLTEDVYFRLGRDAIAELVLRGCGGDEAFYEEVASALYQGRKLHELPLSDLHKQIASLTVGRPKFPEVAQIYTTNFDPLLEIAFSRAHGEKPQQVGAKKSASDTFRMYRKPRGSKDPKAKGKYPAVNHLHGWIDPDGSAAGEIVYAESHYIDLQRKPKAPANVLATDLFSETGATIILGMSLADPNLRRLLFTHSTQRTKNAGHNTYLVVRKGASESNQIYGEFWKTLGVQTLLVEEYSDIPYLLREIQWGGSSVQHGPPNWFQEARSLRQKPVTEEWFAATSRLVEKLHRQILHMFVTEPRERFRITLFSPSLQGAHSQGSYIYEIGSVDMEGKVETDDAVEWRKRSEARRLKIEDNLVQGLAGSAFRMGVQREVFEGYTAGLDLNFDDELTREFDREFRDWRSMIAVPILRGSFNLPIGVICIQSNFGTPFWKSLPDSRGILDFIQTVKIAARDLLYDTVDWD